MISTKRLNIIMVIKEYWRPMNKKQAWGRRKEKAREEKGKERRGKRNTIRVQQTELSRV